MKRAIGIALLILACIGAFGVVKNWSKPERPRPFGRSAAYDTGRKAGKYTAPFVVLAFALGGLYLLKTSSGYPPVLSAEPRTPWLKTKAAKIVLFSAAGIFALLACFVLLAISTRFFNRRPAHPRPAPATFPNPRPAARAGPSGPAQSGPYQIGTEVHARWAGSTLPGRITQIHPGGFNVMVQLEDPRFPHPILLSTNLLKPR